MLNSVKTTIELIIYYYNTQSQSTYWNNLKSNHKEKHLVLVDCNEKKKINRMHWNECSIYTEYSK